MVRVSAYVLAADPTWIQRTVPAYYDDVDTLVVSFDEEHRGWTGAPINVDQCLERLHALDHQKKIVILSGDFHSSADPLDADTRQRGTALDRLRESADWILQLDTDELLPDTRALRHALKVAASLDCMAVEWPMRVLYRRIGRRTYLQIAKQDGSAHYEYPGPIAVRADSSLVLCRRTDQRTLRVVVRGDSESAAEATGPTWEIEAGQAIWHNSWARSPASVLSKIRSWGHNDGGRIYRYYATTWLPSPVLWPLMRDVHPFSWGRWDRLTPVTLPADAGR